MQALLLRKNSMSQRTTARKSTSIAPMHQRGTSLPGVSFCNPVWFNPVWFHFSIDSDTTGDGRKWSPTGGGAKKGGRT